MSAPAIHALPGESRPFVVDGALTRLVDVIVAAGGRPVAVGGSVRDHLLGMPPKDVDVEVYALPLARLETVLAAAAFDVHAVGRAFGVLKVVVEHEGTKHTFDVALPRTESKSGQGHRGFVVASDESLDPAQAAARRDFTVNAIGVDLATGALVDPWHGVDDLRAGVLRHVSSAFDEDPLRVLRAAQFAARLSFSVAPETIARCASLVPELTTLPVERVGAEMDKLMLKGVWPSVGLNVLRETGAVAALFPELHALVGCPQEPEWHPEGDVWTHTLMVVDEAAVIARNDRLDDGERRRVLLGALCHDLGKPATTEHVEGRVRSRDHESQGEGPTRTFLARLAVAHDVIDDVVALVRDHLKPFQLWNAKASDAAVRRLALKCPLPRLARVACADHFGRTTLDALTHDDTATAWLLAQAERLQVQDAAPTPLLLGRHLVARGLRPGPSFGALLKEAFEAQLDGTFHDEAGALAWLSTRLAS